MTEKKKIFDARNGVIIDSVEPLPYGAMLTIRSRPKASAPSTAKKPRHTRARTVVLCALLLIAASVSTAACPAFYDVEHEEQHTETVQVIADEPHIYTAEEIETMMELRVAAAKSKIKLPTLPDAPKEAPSYDGRMEDCVISHYCVERYPHICGEGQGVTKSGREVEAGVSVAVDPQKIPLGSRVFVDYGDGIVHEYRADDTGNAVIGNHIDVAVATHADALALGMKTATVWWREP